MFEGSIEMLVMGNGGSSIYIKSAWLSFSVNTQSDLNGFFEKSYENDKFKYQFYISVIWIFKLTLGEWYLLNTSRCKWIVRD